ncbi:transcriptional regulator protein hcngp [Anaeramoeba flamelloides]|uniref:Transcriptional regulator protein hcngp n=1 Tax=Anaeramoeba flamelloides TaxID=1746091 RepID=A0ABQ8X4C5_9EUKA|nr:transcriptional regulator protein hcngp [Anaeramoeba flamelloides]
MSLSNDYSGSDEETEQLQPSDVTRLFESTHPLSIQFCDYVISKGINRNAFLDQEKLMRLDKIIKRYLETGKNYNGTLKKNNFFQNPCVSEKLITKLNVVEHGTNLGNNFFNPEFWKKQTTYKDLEKQQNESIKQIEKEKRQKQKEAQQLERNKRNSNLGLTKSQRKRQMKKQKYAKRNKHNPNKNPKPRQNPNSERHQAKSKKK